MSNNTVFEYVGKHPLHTIRHGNSRTPGGEYVKTAPTVKKATVANLTQYKEPRQIHTDVVLDDSMKATRDLRQVQNMKYADKKAKRETTHTDEGWRHQKSLRTRIGLCLWSKAVVHQQSP